jgi:hypothetical protein
MARRNRDLAGLAALGALGLYMGRDGNKGAVRGVGEDRKESVESEERRPLRLPDDFAERETGIIPQDPRGLNEYGDRVGLQQPARAPAGPANASTRPAANRSMATKANQEPYKNPQRGPSFEEISAYNRSRQTAGTSTKPRGSTNRAGSSAADQIPIKTSSNVVASDTDASLRVDEDEASRNIGNALSALPGGAGLKGAHRLAKYLATPRMAEYSQPLISGPVKRLTGPSKAELTAAERAARDAARRAETARENAARYNTEGPLGGEGFIMRKKGGMVKAKKMASGGMTSKPSSASSRADGIASRGKTKCKMY